MGRRALAVLAVLAVGGCGGGAAKPSAPAEHAAHAAGPHLTPAVARALHTGFAQDVKDSGVPGATAAIVFPDGHEWTDAEGLAVLQPATPMTSGTSFSLDSVTKMATAALALRLAEQGKLSLDDPIRRWYPAWRGDRAATVRDLLGHTAGLTDPDFRWIVRHPDRATTPQQYLAALSKPGPRTREGNYSNAGLVIAGRILERAGGAPAATLMRRELFADRPGGDGLALQPGEHARRPVAHDYWYPRGVSHPVDATRDGGFIPNRTFVGLLTTAAGLAGSDLSIARWTHQLLGGHILEPASLHEMTRFHSLSNFDRYGLGLMEDSVDGHEMWGHVGDGWGSHTELWHLPAQDLTVAVSWNDDLIDSDAPMLRTLVRGALAQSVP